MFKYAMKQVIDNEMVEKYSDVISDVTFCSGLGGDHCDNKIAEALMTNDKISYRPDNFRLRDFVQPYYYDTIVLVHHPTREPLLKYRAIDQGKLYHLEYFAKSVKGWDAMKGFSEPLPAHWFNRKSHAYKKMKAQVFHGARGFVTDV